MRRVKVIINYADVSVPELIEMARNTVTKMSVLTTVFTTPDVAYATITASATALETKYNAAHGGGKQQTADMKQAQKALLDLLRKQAMYVERIANGNETTILSSGFDASKQPVYTAQPDFTATNGEHSGEIVLKHKKVQDAKSWVFQSSKDAIDWKHEGVSIQAMFVVEGLTPVSKYYFRCAWVGIAGQSEWSQAVSEVVK